MRTPSCILNSLIFGLVKLAQSGLLSDISERFRTISIAKLRYGQLSDCPVDGVLGSPWFPYFGGHQAAGVKWMPLWSNWRVSIQSFARASTRFVVDILVARADELSENDSNCCCVIVPSLTQVT